MSAPPLQGYVENGNMPNDMNGVGQTQVNPSQPIAGPSNYARQTQQIPLQQLQQPFYGVNGHIPQYSTAQPAFPLPAQQQAQAFMAPFTPGMPQFPVPQMMQYPAYDANPAGIIPNFHFGTVSQPAWQDDWPEDMPHDGQEMIYSNLEVKHRRRTTPDQLKILEYWYDINPKPDNSLREHLAAQLGMTKRNVQVWFQNRRAKMKGLAKKEEKAAEGGEGGNSSQGQNQTPDKAQTAPPVQVSVQHRQVLLPPMVAPNMTRRASLANGEAAKIGDFVAKRAAAASGQLARHAGLRAPGYVSPQRSPLLGSASAARRQSIPYPTPITAGPAGGLSMSPKFSPVARVMPSALHLTAMRNNTRRASMPGAAQLISSGPFTPPRVVTNQHQVGTARGTRELSPIKDHDSEGSHQFLLSPEESEFNTTYITPPSSAYNPSDISPISYLPTNSTSYDPSLPFSSDSPLPNPAFSFGGADMAQQLLQQQQQQQQQHQPVLDEAEAARQQQLFLAFQQRGRMGSIASINTLGTDNGNGTDLDEANISEWSLAGQDLPETFGQDAQGAPDGFDPDARRSSAPADLLHQINLMGLNNLNPSPIRPSPLGTHFTSDEFHSAQTFDASSYLTPTDAPTSSDLSPMGSNSLGSSEGPSPTQAQSNYSHSMQHQQQQQQQQHHLAPGQIIRSASLQTSPGQMHVQAQGSMSGMEQSSSVSPYSDHSSKPPHAQSQTYGQQTYQSAMYDGYQPPVGGIGHPSHQTQAQAHPQIQNQQPTHIQQHHASNSTSSGGGSGDSTGKDDFAFLNDLTGGNDAVNILV
ncbi:hypothetical protein I316_00527 [Kwoniella heveanensis BCC8398]|uniref:Homeobox domain-containing protein n=1 Tax=Kwoniella heveanensis BCC8398 TaxID=1296120 RepID=A0A1B9H2A8_9TREE|nr:hypothetical protein I316_00527 [Kwoniella heveanensis BCC8398]